MKIKLYKTSSFKYTPFDDFVEGDLEYLNDNNIIIVNTISEADIIISQNYKHIKSHFWRGLFGNKKFLIWTLESRFDIHFSKVIKSFFGLVKCHIMNVYTRDVFVSNLTFHSGVVNRKLDLLPSEFKLNSKVIIALMSFYKGLDSESVLRDGINLDLIRLRTQIALNGNEFKVMDVYGKGWPKNVSKEDSRLGNWGTRKNELMEGYHFNLCFENTATYNYMTEKIWDSIKNYCLPIYYGKHTSAYELFPENSFIDYSNFNSPEELFQYILDMNDEEFIKRMNKCIIVFNEISDKGSDFGKIERRKMLNKIVTNVNYIYNNK